MAKGFGGVPGNMQALMKQAQKMQQDLLKAQQEAELFSCEGSAGGGAIKVTANGKQELTSVLISKEVVNSDDVEMLQDLVKDAVNDALAKVKDHTKNTLGSVTGGLNIPGLF